MQHFGPKCGTTRAEGLWARRGLELRRVVRGRSEGQRPGVVGDLGEEALAEGRVADLVGASQEARARLPDGHKEFVLLALRSEDLRVHEAHERLAFLERSEGREQG